MRESKEELERLHESSFAALILDKEHSAIGEQLGVERTWVVEELGDDEVMSLSTTALNTLGEVVSRAHAKCGSSFHFEKLIYDDWDRGQVQVLLETDLDPSLAKQWWSGEGEP
jgi:hypothetical protein